MTSVQSAASTSDPVILPAARKQTVDYDSFLKLLVAQMKNQDPTQPTESAEYLAQFAAFATVEQGLQTNASLELLLQQGTAGMAGGLIGRHYSGPDHEGTVTAVMIAKDGLDVKLSNGATVRLAAGATIS